METWYYDVVSIDGDYANLKRCDIESACGKGTAPTRDYGGKQTEIRADAI